MPVLDTRLDVRSADFKASVAAMARVVADLRATVERIAFGGPEAARQKHLARGKLLSGARQAAAARAGRCTDRPRFRVPRIVAARRLRHVR
ncbi:MAG: hypothetical protein AW12_01737 [Candidatus Accumulibacter sp. BA-94]|nr:MAG: hypothetical protein AW12_01737 [Candidatus Accumulibacter sp. BA-94]